MTRRAVASAGILCAISLTMSSCGADGAIIRSGDAFVLVGAEGDGDGDNRAGVGFGGTVALVGNCLGINDATVVWPYGTKVIDEDPLTVEVPGLGQVGVGGQLSGGAEVYEDHLPEGIDDIPSGCPTALVVVFYPDE